MEEDEFRTYQENPAKVDELFQQLARECLVSWVELAETHLADTGIRCFVTGGNDDDPSVLESMYLEGTESFSACEKKVAQIDEDHNMFSLGFSTPTPWKIPREVTDEELGNMIENLVQEVADLGKCIFNFHDPPIDSTLDTCPLLDWNTNPPQPIVKAGQTVMHGAGSKSVRRSLEKYQPMLGLHGHIHEAQASVKIGRTTCINPGSEYGEGVLRGCLVNFSGGEVESYQMTRG